MDRVACVNLDRRPDRWERFVAGLPADWPWPKPERVSAIDGQVCPPPDWWKQGPGAWGCYRSHLRIVEECLRDGVNSVLLLEDDAVFPEGFTARALEFMQHVPSDWGMVYLGGQHLMANRSPPKQVNDRVVRPYNVNRTHAFALRGETMKKVYKHLCDTKTWQRGHHVDHHLGRFHMRMRDPVYAPSEWLVGQAEGKSNINGRVVPERFWVGGKAKPRMVMILGTHRSGSSCLAGVVHRLGVFMGGPFIGCEPDGGHEDKRLAQLCESSMPFPTTKPRMLRGRVANFVKMHSRRAALTGVKYPHLCAMAKEFDQVADLVLVSADRPLEASIASLIRRDGHRRDHKKLEAVQRYLHGCKEGFLSGRTVFRVEYDELLADPRSVVEKLADYLGVPLSEGAISYVRPEMRHVTENGLLV